MRKPRAELECKVTQLPGSSVVIAKVRLPPVNGPPLHAVIDFQALDEELSTSHKVLSKEERVALGWGGNCAIELTGYHDMVEAYVQKMAEIAHECGISVQGSFDPKYGPQVGAKRKAEKCEEDPPLPLPVINDPRLRRRQEKEKEALRLLSQEEGGLSAESGDRQTSSFLVGVNSA